MSDEITANAKESEMIIDDPLHYQINHIENTLNDLKKRKSSSDSTSSENNAPTHALGQQTAARIINSDKLCQLFCQKLRLGLEVETAAKTIARKLPSFAFSKGQTQVSLAAACVYMAAQSSISPKTAKEIENECGVQELVIYQLFEKMSLENVSP